MRVQRPLVILIIILSIFLLSGCNKILPLFKDKKPEVISNLSASSIMMDSNEIRSQTIQIINNAKKSIFIELSAIDDQEIINLLISKSRNGIKVHILLDQWQRENSETVKYLKNQNVSVQYYPAQKGQYQRIRYLVADYQVAVFYGNDWTAKGFATHTMAIKLTGDAAWTIAKSFDKDWSYTTTLSLGLPETMNLPQDNIIFTLSSGVKPQLLKQINAASKEIIAEVEQISDPDTVEALVQAKKRGCTVKLIVSPSCAVATPNTIKKFKESEIQVRYYNSPNKIPMGFNLSIFDNKTMMMTSSSWTYYSFVINHEGALIIPSPTASESISKVLSQEWENASLP
ncbi:MAG: phosphatidylserine/phosphatidylglycerophosphate/cardiolipin synthase family protein [Peptococcaceae bacterium]|nr:phosphatidylserine/phosphatidylglycerophosphate/cardiolipin synthase family protein [Peptococcaceae bacterium]